MPFRRLRADDEGFTLIELMVAMAIGSIVLTALMTVFIHGADGAIKSSERVDALQRGRQAMDRVVTLLNSQSCLVATNGDSQPPIIDGQDNQVTFYAALGLVDTDPTIYRLRYDAATKRLWEDQFAPVRDATGNATYPTYPGAPNVSKVIGTNIVPKNATTPIFGYWQFVTNVGPTLGEINPTPLTAPLDATEKLAAVRMTIAFVTQPAHSASATPEAHATALESTATVGSANPGEPTKGVNC